MAAFDKGDHQVVGFSIEPEDFAQLKEINRRLFGDGSHLTADARRDLANQMHVILSRAHALTERDLR